MKKLDIQGIIFDYGGTIDTNSIHWSEILWKYYKECDVPVSYEDFRNAYVFAERTLAKYPYICSYHNFFDVLVFKINLELAFLQSEHIINMDIIKLNKLVNKIAHCCYNHVNDVLTVTRPVIEKLSCQYPLVLVSNFYGNIKTILKDFNLDTFFIKVIESSVVGLRKPDPAIYQMGVDALGINPDKILVVGDSFSKDVVPAKKIGCKVVWLEGKGWGNEVIDKTLADYIISDLKQLTELL